MSSVEDGVEKKLHTESGAGLPTSVASVPFEVESFGQWGRGKGLGIDSILCRRYLGRGRRRIR